MKFILSSIPKEIREEYEEIWLEYLHNRTEIARFVHRIDKLEMALQADQYAKQGYADKLLAPFFESAKTAVGDAGDIVSETKIFKTDIGQEIVHAVFQGPQDRGKTCKS